MTYETRPTESLTLSASAGEHAVGPSVPGGSAPRVDVVRTTVVVSLAHALVDAYAGFVPPLLPRIMDKLGLSIALAATVAMTFSLATAVLQPILGWLSDRCCRRAFVIGGPLLSGVFLSLIGLAPTYSVLLAFLILAGLGNAAFHPPGAALAARVEAGAGSGARVSAFGFAGAAGYAVGPVAVVWLVAHRGLEGMWVAMLPALLLTPVALLALPRPPASRPGRLDRGALRELLADIVGPLAVVFAISTVAAFIQRVYLTLAPIIVAQAGGSEVRGAYAVSVYLAAQALGTVLGGFLTDRMDRRTLLVTLSLAAIPAHALAFALHPGSGAGLTAAAVAGFLNMAMVPPVVVMAQEMLPARAALGSGIVLGLAWAVASVAVIAVGAVADYTGPLSAALLSVPLLLGATVLALHPSLAPHARGSTGSPT